MPNAAVPVIATASPASRRTTRDDAAAKGHARPTSHDVARRAGVHQSTVSRALAPGGQVAAATRDRVRAAAIELGYTPNAIARGLITRRSGLVGILVGGLSSPFQPLVLERLVQGLTEAGARPLVFGAAPGQDVADLLPIALEYRPDALVVTSSGLDSGRVDACVRDGTPVVLFNRVAPGSDAHAVACDNAGGGRLAADALLAGGGRRFAFLAGDDDSSTNRERERGFVERLGERGVGAVAREPGADAYTYEAGRDAALCLLGRPDPPDALFCASDILALGARDACRDLGARVPEDVQIVGFDDIPMAAWPPYDLTTVRQPIPAMIGAAVELATSGTAGGPAVRVLPGELVARGSTRPVGNRRGDGDG